MITVHNGIKEYIAASNDKVRMRSNVINILTASRIDKVKGLYNMMESIQILYERKLPFHYYIIGEGPELDKLKYICKLKGLDDYVSFERYKSNVADWLNAADIFALPSIYEYHSIALLEAMRTGCPIIATDVGGNSESIDNMKQGILVTPNNPIAFADEMERLIKDKKLRDKLAVAAKERFRNEFTENIMKRNIVNVLKS